MPAPSPRIASARVAAFLLAALGLFWAAQPPGTALAQAIDPASLTADFPERDRLPQTDAPESAWYSGRYGSWGPRARTYPGVEAPKGADPSAWKRLRVAAVARRHEGLAYRHHHIPAWNPGEGQGLDCSNFTSWVYNYGLGVGFTSLISAQADGPQAPGRRLAPGEPFKVGDLLFITTKSGARVSHVVLWLGEGRIIDSHGEGVRVRRFTGWYSECFSHARRVVE
ncbi:hypothetical protein NNJEOMEG_01173 [Fundidesulfovibrio magnetotacticus]|uniref:NlpC/P60 domain-containing protein n=1 Tax=Fundidesulfovibrio magnetotacticus TaxID=2730080 RepID=A0A6V8LS05_9BACT|nr:NlpC/P60 family protein [Fundidesulfovibrio magnetotacticus]GFK93341.1 hypothetical protein NNJEOMEG_01173 [Fundidesulfovibrio magnetotacticus]